MQHFIKEYNVKEPNSQAKAQHPQLKHDCEGGPTISVIGLGSGRVDSCGLKFCPNQRCSKNQKFEI